MSMTNLSDFFFITSTYTIFTLPKQLLYEKYMLIDE